MLSRSTLLLRREHRQFELLPLPKVRKIEPYAVAVRRQDEAAYWLNWTLFVVPEDGDYDRTEIQVNISFKEDYDRSPPVFSLANIVFHPNVDPTSGDVSTPSVATWQEGGSLRDAITSVIYVLEHPLLDPRYVLNQQAATLYVEDRDMFATKVAECQTTIKTMKEDPDAFHKLRDPFQIAFESLPKVPVLPMSEQKKLREQEAAAKPKLLPPFDFLEYQRNWAKTGTTISAAKLHSMTLPKSQRQRNAVTYDPPVDSSWLRSASSTGQRETLSRTEASELDYEDEETVAPLRSDTQRLSQDSVSYQDPKPRLYSNGRLSFNIIAPPISAGSLSYLDGDDILAWTEQLVEEPDIFSLD